MGGTRYDMTKTWHGRPIARFRIGTTDWHGRALRPKRRSSRNRRKPNSLEAVELELALHNQNLVSLGFEELIRTALKATGGEILFQMRSRTKTASTLRRSASAATSEREFALVIMPPDGGLMRVEPVAQSSNPIAAITESYAGLMDVFRAARVVASARASSLHQQPKGFASRDAPSG